uniref:Uncharacterized protein n=1 Tax=Anopheles atroparvus TaxID=41427 RepID=A0AAG5DWX6_ANOAO
MDHIAEVTAGLAYAPAGILFGYLLLQPLADDQTIVCLYEETLYWPYIIAIVAMLVTVVLTNGLKLNYRKTQFIHLYLDLAACLFSFAAGLVFLLVDDIVPAVYLGAIAIGLTLVPGLSYLHIRSKGRHRAMYMSLCSFWFLCGVASTATIAAQDSERVPAADGGWVQDTLHQNVAIALLAASALVLVLIGLVELLQREAIVDYRKPLDYDTAMAHDSGRLLGGHRRSFGTFAHFGRSLQPGKASTGATVWGGGSTEQMVGPAGGWGGCRYRSLWTAYAIATKLVGLLAFYWVLLDLGLAATVALLKATDAWYCVFWLLAAGALLTTLLTLLLSPKLLFLLASVLYLVGLVLAVAFYAADLRPLEYGIAKLVFFACLGAALPLPAINILELAPLNCNEAALALGITLELLAIALLQYFGTVDGTLYGIPELAEGEEAEADKDVIAGHYIAAIVLGIVCAVLVLWHTPNTKRKSLPEIESDLGRMRSYFAFSRRVLPSQPQDVAARTEPTGPLQNGHHTAAESIASLGELADEGQLSARNATRFAGLYTESPGPRRDGSYDSRSRSRSPYNDFNGLDHHLPANGLNHQHHYAAGPHDELRLAAAMMGARSLTAHHPHPDEHTYQLQQEALQRQHEANYLNARLMHQQLQQRGLDSPTGSDQFSGRARGSSPLPLTPDAIQPVPLLPRLPVARSGSRSVAQPLLGSLTVKSEPGAALRPILLTQKSEAPAPPPMPPADYLTKSLPRVKAVRQSRIPPIVPKPEPPEEVIVPGVEYSHNLVPSQFLRQSLQNSQLFR